MDFLRNLFSSTLGLGAADKVLDELTLEGVAQYIKSGKCKNILCMVGAGISTSAGIPDFRSPGTGLYANLQKYNLPYPEAIFQIDYFKKHPEPFFALAKELYPGQFKPTVCHYFMKLLKDKGLLSRCYTQNIDTLERVAGLEGEDLIEAHGTFYTSHCVSFCCRKEYNLDWMKEKIFSDDIPRCDKCSSLVKPDIVFFGENLPVRFFTSMKMDFPRCDLLIIMGTSLQVQPFASLVSRVSKSCPRLLINMEKAGQADPLFGLLGFGGGMDFDSEKAYRILKTCASQLSPVLGHLYNLSLSQEKVPMLWKTSCLVPVPKKSRPSDPVADYRPVALTSHVMKVLERLVLAQLRPQKSMMLSSTCYNEPICIWMVEEALRITFFDFSSAFNTIQLRCYWVRSCRVMGVDDTMISWITDYLTGRPQFVRLGSVLSDVVVSDTGAPQGTVLSPFLFTLYTTDFQYNSESCHLQKFSDDSAVVGCIREGEEGEYRTLVDNFVEWSEQNHLRLNVNKTRAMVIDFRSRRRCLHSHYGSRGEVVDEVEDYKYLGVMVVQTHKRAHAFVSRAVHSPVNGTTAIPWRSSRRRLLLLEQLRGCQEAWCPAAPWDREGAHAAICGTPAGSFLVVRDSETSQPSLLCVSAGGENKAVLDYDIKITGTVFQLSESRLSFSDLAQLVLFYSLTRDVLAVCLSIPRWIYSVTERNKDRLSQLEPSESSLCDSCRKHKTRKLTSTNGALCIINPLYLREHGDDWLTQRASALQCPKQRRLSTTRKWAGAGLHSKRAISLEQDVSDGASVESSGLIRAKSADSPHCPPTPSTPAVQAVVLRRPSRDAGSSPPHRASTGSLPPSSPSTPGTLNSELSELQHHGSPVPQSPHRVSWIEDGVWLPPPRPNSLLHPPSLELDSLSISSVEEEQESQTPSPTPHHPSAHRLADKVIHRLSGLGQVLGGLVSQKKRLTNRVQEMSERKGGAFAEAVKEFVETTLKRGADPDGVRGSEFLQEVRSSLTSLRETLLDYPEIQALLDSITDINDSEIDSLVELSLHKVALKPVSAHLYSCIHTSRTDDSTFERLQSNLRVLEKKRIEDLGGSAGVGVPDSVTLERIQQRWTSMHEAYSPNKKVQILLKVCKSIYHSMSANASSAGKVFGADDFLPCLTWVLLRSDVVTLQLDIDYMMELLDPTQLQGEGGYYLTTLYASLYYITSFQPRLAARLLSVEAQNSLNKWHRRRTLHCNQSRRSNNRRTIRRQACRETNIKNSETESGSKEKGGKEADTVDVDESQQETVSTKEPLKEEGRNEQG
ncbi:hypothetical protein L3Q82_019033, partial [Scortum barcoo]